MVIVTHAIDISLSILIVSAVYWNKACYASPSAPLPTFNPSISYLGHTFPFKLQQTRVAPITEKRFKTRFTFFLGKGPLFSEKGLNLPDYKVASVDIYLQFFADILPIGLLRNSYFPG